MINSPSGLAGRSALSTFRRTVIETFVAVGESFTVLIVNSASSHRSVFPAAPASGMIERRLGTAEVEHDGNDAAQPGDTARVVREPEAELGPHPSHAAAPVEREVRAVVERGREVGRLGDKRLAEVVARLDEPGGRLLGKPHAGLDHDIEARRRT